MYKIASASANLTTGAYVMTLPAAPPRAGAYSNALPIVLTAATVSAGLYMIEADAALGATHRPRATLQAAASSTLISHFSRLNQFDNDGRSVAPFCTGEIHEKSARTPDYSGLRRNQRMCCLLAGPAGCGRASARWPGQRLLPARSSKKGQLLTRGAITKRAKAPLTSPLFRGIPAGRFSFVTCRTSLLVL